MAYPHAVRPVHRSLTLSAAARLHSQECSRRRVPALQIRQASSPGSPVRAIPEITAEQHQCNASRLGMQARIHLLQRAVGIA